MAVRKLMTKKRVIPVRCIPFGKPLKKNNVFFGSNKFKSIKHLSDGRTISAHSLQSGIAHIGYIDGEYFVSRQSTHVNPNEITEFSKLEPQKRKIVDGKIRGFEHFRTIEITGSQGRVIKNVKK